MNTTWNNIIKDEMKKTYFKELISSINKDRLSMEIYPKKEDVFKAFELCPFRTVKVVVLGQDPYHNVNQSHGLAFSVNDGIKIPPSLRNIFKELKTDLNIDAPSNGDLTKWAKQGVLLLNTVLTVEAHKPLSHKGLGWEQFTDNVIHMLNKDDAPKVFVLWGNNAIKKGTLINNHRHMIIESSHPSPLSARHSFFGSRVFSRINKFLLSNGLKEIDFELT